MSGTSRRGVSLSASDAPRAGEGSFFESASGRGSGSGLAGREQGCGVLGERGEATALLPGGSSPAREPPLLASPRPASSPSCCGHPSRSARHARLILGWRRAGRWDPIERGTFSLWVS